MKTRDKIVFGVGLVILILFHLFLFPISNKEGFFDEPGAYDALRGRLRNDLASYCKLSWFVREKIKEMQNGFGGGASDISQMYTAVYQCTDQLASVRPSCASPNRTAMRFVPCSIFMELPDWTDETNAIQTLQKIKDDLPERLIRECEWFAASINKIKEGLAAGANPAAGSNPVGVAPTLDQMNAFNEGFQGKCSAQANEYIRRKALEDEAKNCSPLTASSEIARVNSLLDDSSVRNSVSKCNGMMNEMLKLQSDLEKLKNGNLYDWQKDGPKKTYDKFKGGDRIQAFLFSLRQNQ